MVNNQEPRLYELHPTADVGEDALLLWVPETALQPARVRTLGTPLKNFMTHAAKDDSVRWYGDYQLTAPGPRRDDGYRGFWFAKNKSVTTRLDATGTSTAYKTTEVIEDYDWPPVLRVLYALSGTKSDGSDNTNGSGDPFARTRPLLIERMELVPGGRYPSKVIVEDFHSPVPFTDLKAERPQTDTVYWALPNASLSSNPHSLTCLHGLLVFREQFSAGRLVPGWGTIHNLHPRRERGQMFAPTNHPTWIKHTFMDDMPPDPVNGVYTRRRKTVIPPRMPPAQIL